MGEIISIQEEIRPYDFRIRYTNGEERVVTVDPDKRELFRTQKSSGKLSVACPFLRRTGPVERICTVHAGRPGLCRSYTCYRILILRPDGIRAGRVPVGTHSLITGDPSLYEIWHREIKDTLIPDEEDWEAYVEGVFIRTGYRVIR
jgi:hypothetical protein